MNFGKSPAKLQTGGTKVTFKDVAGADEAIEELYEIDIPDKAKAMRILKSRLLQAEQDRLHAERAEARKSQVGTGDRSARVRTYNWPQNRITDHRLGDEDKNHSLEQFVNGKLEPLLDALILLDREERIRAL